MSDAPEFPELLISGLDTDSALEAECQQMLRVGVEWLYKNPDLRPYFKGYFGMTGIITPRNLVAKEVWTRVSDALGEMGRPNLGTQQCVMSHIVCWHRRFYYYITTQKLPAQEAWRLAWEDMNSEIAERQKRVWINGPGRYNPLLGGDGTEDNEGAKGRRRRQEREKV
jgi:hypothetical protein